MAFKYEQAMPYPKSSFQKFLNRAQLYCSDDGFYIFLLMFDKYNLNIYLDNFLTVSYTRESINAGPGQNKSSAH